MQPIDLESWSRKEHFDVFKNWDYPHFSLCVNVSLETFYSFIKQKGISFNIAIVYLITRAANAVPEFRYRIRDEKPIEHEIIHPSSTILGKDDVFSFCTLEYYEDFSKFSMRASNKIAQVQKRPRLLKEDQNRDDLIFLTAIPWVSFTSIMHPLKLNPADSVPRFSWGKYFEDGKDLKMPLSVQAHHAVMDGVHVGRFYTEVQAYLNEPDVIVG